MRVERRRRRQRVAAREGGGAALERDVTPPSATPAGMVTCIGTCCISVDMDGISLQDANAYTLPELKEGGYKPLELGEAGYQIVDLRAAKFSALDLRKARRIANPTGRWRRRIMTHWRLR